MNDIIEPDPWYLEILNCRCPICGELSAFLDDELGHVFHKRVSCVHILVMCRYCHRVFITDVEKRTATRLPEIAWSKAP